MSSRPWTDFAGRALYLDTMIFYAFLRTEVAKPLFTRIEMGSLEAYTSVLTFDELTYKLLLALIRDNYPGSPLEHLRDQEEAMIAEFYPRLAPLLGQLLSLATGHFFKNREANERQKLPHSSNADLSYPNQYGKCSNRGGLCDRLSSVTHS